MVAACLFSHTPRMHRALNAAWSALAGTATAGYGQDCGVEHVSFHKANKKLMFIISIPNFLVTFLLHMKKSNNLT